MRLTVGSSKRETLQIGDINTVVDTFFGAKVMSHNLLRFT